MANPGVRWVVGGWCAFLAENFILSENRQQIIEQVGENGYQAAYSTLSTASVASIFYGYRKHADRSLRRGLPLRGAGLVLKASGAALLAQGLPALRNFGDDCGGAKKPSGDGGGGGDPKASMKSMCPMDLQWAKNAEGCEVYGAKRVTRHPQLWGAALYGIGAAASAACPVVQAASLGFVPAAVLLGGHMDNRYQRGVGGTMSEEVRTTTSHVPFVAVATGHQSLEQAWAESKRTNAAVGAFLATFVTLLM